jgi:AcrR family transcriptional regulator
MPARLAVGDRHGGPHERAVGGDPQQEVGDAGARNRETAADVAVDPAGDDAGVRALGKPRWADDRPVEITRGHLRFHGKHVSERVLEESAQYRLEERTGDKVVPTGVHPAGADHQQPPGGYSEVLLYKHFHDKTEIFLSVLGEHLPAFETMLDALIADPTSASPRTNLTRLTRVALAFYVDSLPIAVSVFSSREVLAALRTTLAESGAGPHHPLDGVVTYLHTEVSHGRINEGADLEAAASLLLEACFQQAFLFSFDDQQPDESMLDDLAGRLAGLVHAGLRDPTAHVARD